jgi:hypothetical protein
VVYGFTAKRRIENMYIGERIQRLDAKGRENPIVEIKEPAPDLFAASDDADDGAYEARRKKEPIEPRNMRKQYDVTRNHGQRPEKYYKGRGRATR